MQIKGRGTHQARLSICCSTIRSKPLIAAPQKTGFKLFDFFANCEYFEDEFNYDEVLHLPARPAANRLPTTTATPPPGGYTTGGDALRPRSRTTDWPRRHAHDRMFFNRFEETVKADDALKTAVADERWEQASDYVVNQLFDKPSGVLHTRQTAPRGGRGPSAHASRNPAKSSA